MINVVAFIRAKTGAADRVRAGLENIIAPTHAEPANHQYVLHVDLDDPNLFVLYEEWDSREALEEHLKLPHLQSFVAECGDAFAAPLEVHVLHYLAGKR